MTSIWTRHSGRLLVRKVIPLIILILSLCEISCTTDTGKQNTVDETSIDLTPSNIMWDSDIVFTDSLITKASVHSRRARVYNDKQETLLDTAIVVRFYNSTGGLAALLHCDRVRVDNRSNNMYASGHVVVEAEATQTRVETNTMMWDNIKRKLYSNEYVRVTKPHEMIEGGIGFESDESMTNYRIFRVTGVKQE